MIGRLQTDRRSTMKINFYASTILILTTPAFAALPGNSADGKRLHDAHCTTCHNTSVYTRKDHSVRSMAELKEQLQGCAHMANKKLTEAEAQNLVKYLNDQFYRFQ